MSELSLEQPPLSNETKICDDGVQDNCLDDCEQDDDYEKHIRSSAESASQHKISDLIRILTCHLEKEGDLPMLYCSDECACKFESFSDFCSVGKVESSDKKFLMLGDFHVEGCDYLCSWLDLKYVKKSSISDGKKQEQEP